MSRLAGTGTALPPAPGEDVSVALALVNSLAAGPAGQSDQLATPVEIARWIRSCGLGSVTAVHVSDEDVAALAELRTAIRELFTAAADEREPDLTAVSLVNADARLVLGAPALRWLAGPPQQRWQAERPDTAANALALIARDAIEIVCGPLGPVIHHCEAHGCDRMFFRTHGRRRWCSNTCGDRVRVARHYLARKARRPAKASQQPAPGP
ncbi:MAG TPA: CGNR zinc finger domain-containing protein [Streptosporangiaceae bacterium]|nr:CGNR zinc finger domain-containing protein [Streptosporangiaceae bacterium]